MVSYRQRISNKTPVMISIWFIRSRSSFSFPSEIFWQPLQFNNPSWTDRGNTFGPSILFLVEVPDMDITPCSYSRFKNGSRFAPRDTFAGVQRAQHPLAYKVERSETVANTQVRYYMHKIQDRLLCRSGSWNGDSRPAAKPIANSSYPASAEPITQYRQYVAKTIWAPW